MNLFDSTNTTNAAKLAHLNVKLWEAALSLRICIQKPVDICNKLPLFNRHGEKSDSSLIDSEIRKFLQKLIDLQDHQISRAETKTSKKRKFDAMAVNTDEIWEHIAETDSKMKCKWKPTVDKWHARLNYGSEKSKSKLKVLNTTIWDQVRSSLAFYWLSNSFLKTID